MKFPLIIAALMLSLTAHAQTPQRVELCKSFQSYTELVSQLRRQHLTADESGLFLYSYAHEAATQEEEQTMMAIADQAVKIVYGFSGPDFHESTNSDVARRAFQMCILEKYTF